MNSAKQFYSNWCVLFYCHEYHKDCECRAVHLQKVTYPSNRFAHQQQYHYRSLFKQFTF